MSFISQKFLRGVNDRTQLLAEKSFTKINENLVWPKFAKKVDLSGSAENKIYVPVEDEHIDSDVDEGFLAESTSFTFDIDLTVKFASRAKTIKRSQYTDGPLGAAIMASFGEQMGALFARYPEDLILNAIKANGVTKYDGLSIFHASHLVHPKKASNGTFSNSITGNKIDGSVTIDAALVNLSASVNAMWSIPTASGEHARRMMPKYLVVPPALRNRAIQLTSADFIGASGSSDVRTVVASNGLQVLVVPELGAAFGGSDTVYYLLCELSGDVGAPFFIGEKEQFQLVFWTPADDSAADAAQDFTTRVRGRVGQTNGLPQYILRAGL